MTFAEATTLKRQADATLDTIADMNGGDTDAACQAAAEATVFAELLATRMARHGQQRFGGDRWTEAYTASYDKLRRESGM
jgi:hypothetical protein